MGYLKNNNVKVGEWVITNKVIDSSAGYFEKGTKVKVVGVTERGYDLMDEHGNRVIETGWDSVRKI